MTAAAPWGGPYARTTITDVAALCQACGSATALRLVGDVFVCRDNDRCRRAMRRRSDVQAAVREHLEAIRRS